MSQATASSSAERSSDMLLFNFDRGQESTVWDIVCFSPQGHVLVLSAVTDFEMVHVTVHPTVCRGLAVLKNRSCTVILMATLWLQTQQRAGRSVWPGFCWQRLEHSSEPSVSLLTRWDGHWALVSWLSVALMTCAGLQSLTDVCWSHLHDAVSLVDVRVLMCGL